jgi:hypothetical protein
MQATVRDSIVTAVNAVYPAAYPAVPIVYDNAPFDWNNPPERFVEFEIKFYDGQQIGAAAAPKTRLAGMVYVSVYSRMGTGSRVSLQALDWFQGLLEYSRAGAAQFQGWKPDGTSERKDWFISQGKVPFYADPT